MIGEYLKEKRIGVWNFYHSNGQLRITLSYINGFVNGEVKSYYDNGQLHDDLTMVNDLRDGHGLTYYSNGNLKLDANYTNDRLNRISFRIN